MMDPLSVLFEVIDFHWGLGPVAPMVADFVSIRWTGFVVPKYSEVTTFFQPPQPTLRLAL